MQGILEYWVWFLWSIIDLLCIYKIIHVLFRAPKRKVRKRIWIYLAFYVVIALCRPLVVVGRGSVSTALGFVVVLLYYVKSFPVICECLQVQSKAYIFIHIWLYEEMVAFLSDTVLIIFNENFPIFSEGNVITDYYTVIASCFISCVILCVVCIIQKLQNAGRANVRFHILSLKACIILSVVILFLSFMQIAVFMEPKPYSDAALLKMKISMIFLIVSTVCLIITLFTTSKSNKTNRQMAELLEEQLKNSVVYYNQLSKQDEELRSFKHDVKNLLLGLHSMLENQENEQVKEYLERMKEMYQTGERRYDSGNYLADALLTSKAGVAAQCNTTISLEGTIPTGNISDVDMCVFLTNALDNAIEACEKIEGNKTISIQSKTSNKNWVIEVKNPTRDMVKIDNNRMETTKQNKELHGYGLINMERVADRYNGSIKIYCEEKEFTLRARFQFL